jgi:transposase-like protein
MHLMKRKQYSAQFKAKVALEALKGQSTMNDFVSRYGVHPTQIGRPLETSTLEASIGSGSPGDLLQRQGEMG